MVPVNSCKSCRVRARPPSPFLLLAAPLHTARPGGSQPRLLGSHSQCMYQLRPACHQGLCNKGIFALLESLSFGGFCCSSQTSLQGTPPKAFACHRHGPGSQSAHSQYVSQPSQPLKRRWGRRAQARKCHGPGDAGGHHGGAASRGCRERCLPGAWLSWALRWLGGSGKGWRSRTHSRT